MDLRFDVTIESSTAPAIILRSDASAQNYYLWVVTSGSQYNNPSLFKVTATGGAVSLNTFTGQGYSGSVTNGTQLSYRARIQGANIYLKVWQFGTSEPSSWNCTWADLSITATGYFGFRNQNPGSGAGCSFDNIILDNLVPMVVSPANAPLGFPAFPLSLTESGTSWTSGTPGSPTFTASAGSISTQTVLSASSATIALNTPASGSSLNIGDPTTSVSAPLTLAPPNLYFSDNFDADTAGSLPAWFTATQGTWLVVADASAFSAPNDLQNISAANADILLILGGGGLTVPAQADMILKYITKTVSTSTNGIQPLVRSSSNGQNYYTWLLEVSGGNYAFQLYRSNSGSLTQLGTAQRTGITFVSGQAMHVQVAAVGNWLFAMCWVDGSSQPMSWQASYQDTSGSAVTAAGYAGFFHEGNSGGFAVDNVQVFGDSSLQAGTLSTSGITSSAITVTATSPSGSTAPYTTQYHRSTNANFVPSTTTLVSGATGLILNDNGLSTSTTYYYRQIVTDAAGNVCWTGTASATTSSGTGLSVSPTGLVATQTAAALTLTGTGTSWTGGTPGSPTFTASAGTITSQTVSSATGATIHYNAPSTAQTVTIADPGSGATANLTINAVASDFTVTPASQTTAPGVATGNYAVNLNGWPTSNLSVDMTDFGVGGTFTPTLGTLGVNSSGPFNFTYAPPSGASSGTIALQVGVSGYVGNKAHSANCVVSAGPQTIPVTSANIFWSPANWDHLTAGTFGVATDTMQTTAPGAYLKFGVTGTVNLALAIDNSTTGGFPSGNMPIVSYAIDGGDRVDTQLGQSETSLVISSSLSTAAHQVQVWLRHTSGGQGTRWGSVGVSPTNALRVTGIVLDGGGAMVAPATFAKSLVVYGDSRTEGYNLEGTNGIDYPVNGYAALLARALAAEWGNIGYDSQGITVGGMGGVPAMASAYNLYSAGRDRAPSGVTYVCVLQGYNDNNNSVGPATVQAAAQALIGNLRALYGAETWIFWLYDPSGFYDANFAAAVAAYRAANPSDAKVAYVDISALAPPAALFNGSMGGGSDYTTDGTHFNQFGSGVLASLYATAIASDLESPAAQAVPPVPNPLRTLVPIFISGYAGRDFQPLSTLADDVFAIDLAPALDSGDQLDAATLATVFFPVDVAVDGFATALDGPPLLTGTIAVQAIGQPPTGRYALGFTCRTLAGRTVHVHSFFNAVGLPDAA
jgi:lysophospholipase L1-like esterase